MSSSVTVGRLNTTGSCAAMQLRGSCQTCAETLDQGCEGYTVTGNFYSSQQHNTLHLLCLEIVKLGDSKLKAYSLAMEKLRDVKAALEPVAAMFDGLGLSDGEMPADSVGTGMGHKQNFVMTDSADSGSHCYDGLVYVPLAATKHPMNNPLRGSGFVLSAGFKVRKVVHVHKGVICQKRLESLLAARNVI